MEVLYKAMREFAEEWLSKIGGFFGTDVTC